MVDMKPCFLEEDMKNIQKTKAPCKGKSVQINAFTLAGRL